MVGLLQNRLVLYVHLQHKNLWKVYIDHRIFGKLRLAHNSLSNHQQQLKHLYPNVLKL